MRRRTQYALAFALVLALTAGVVSAGWAVDNPFTSNITRTLSPAYSNELKATVTYNPVSGLYHYLYELKYLQGYNNGALSYFSVGRADNTAFSGQACSTGLVPGTSSSSVIWILGTSVPLNTTVTFEYYSVHSYGLVNATVTGGNRASNGQTLGMTAPEPGSLLAVLFGLGGVLWTRLRRRS